MIPARWIFLTLLFVACWPVSVTAILIWESFRNEVRA